MSARLLAAISVGALAVGLALTAPRFVHMSLAATADLPTDLTTQVTKLLPSVAAIRAIGSAGYKSTLRNGSGFVFDSSGLILTNRHVIEGSHKIVVDLPIMPPLIAKAVFISQRLDLAILKVDAGRPLQAVMLGDSNGVTVGDPVLLIGNGLGLRTALSSGVISATNCDIGDTMYDHYIQTDAALNHGNSGGPMFNMKGEVIGVNTGLISSPNNTGSVGIGFSMPINDAKFEIDQFVQSGQVNAGIAGMRAQRITDDIAAAFKLKSNHGAIVTEVDPDGPADGKISEGDIILSVNGQDASDVPAIARLIATASNGTPLKFELLHGEKERSVAVTVRQTTVDERHATTVLGHAPEEQTMFATPSKPGMKFAPITQDARHKYGLKSNVHGVLITEIDADSIASQRQIRVGEVIEKVGDRSVASPQDVSAALKATANRNIGLAPLLVRGEEGPRWVVLPLDLDP